MAIVSLSSRPVNENNLLEAVLRSRKSMGRRMREAPNVASLPAENSFPIYAAFCKVHFMIESTAATGFSTSQKINTCWLVFSHLKTDEVSANEFATGSLGPPRGSDVPLRPNHHYQYSLHAPPSTSPPAPPNPTSSSSPPHPSQSQSNQQTFTRALYPSVHQVDNFANRGVNSIPHQNPGPPNSPESSSSLHSYYSYNLPSPGQSSSSSWSSIFPSHPRFPPLDPSTARVARDPASSSEPTSLPKLPPAPPSFPSTLSSAQHPSIQRPQQVPDQSNMSFEASRAFFQNAANGAYSHNAGRNWNSNQDYQSHQASPLASPTIAIDVSDGSFHRPIPQSPHLFNPQDVPSARFGDQQASAEGKAIVQSEYLESIAYRELKKEAAPEEMQAKENFRKRLERIVHSILTEYAKDYVLPFDPKQVRLKCYGSLANGFAVAGSDMDLLLMFPKEHGSSGRIESDSRRMLEKVFLDAGFGARLLTQTRVPIMRICERPSQELLDALKQRRAEWEQEDQEQGSGEQLPNLSSKDGVPSMPDSEASDAAMSFYAELDINPADVPLPDSPVHGHAHLEFKGDVGIQCDINFSNYVAIYNTVLLRCYCKWDPRVRQMGLIVKSWAKTRRINNPYHGTLSSYGYIMMVLHYLMNVAKPPVIPNLQLMEKRKRALHKPPLPPKMCEGFDVTFWDDERTISRRATAGHNTNNTETLGSLLRGFFRHYSEFRGFHWTKHVISIRTLNGLLTKEKKGWTGAKWEGLAEKSVRQRYLLAIEDPFEVHHNIARTVGHSGIVAIRDEFRRAFDILNNIQSIPGFGWQWRKPDGSIGGDLFEQAEERGDLHKKDQDGRAERARATRAIAGNTTAKSLGTEADGKAKETTNQAQLTKNKTKHDVAPLPDWSKSAFDPARYGLHSTLQSPPRTPNVVKRAVTGATLPTAEPTPPSTPSKIPDETCKFVTTTTLLDPRQLLDIQTIQKGGNGCVRNGEDFESSWGGGGRMGSDNDVRSRASGRRKGKDIEIKAEGSSDDVGSQWNQVVEGLVRNRRRSRKAKRVVIVSGREVDAGELIGELPFCGNTDD
ncbi:MAG: hypothetical protein Q9160_008610 [Pyrenula sp. 1 TL-2023]